jgi:Ca2+-transporting ATPase
VLHKPFANKWLNLAIVWELVLLAAILFFEPLERVFGTTALNRGEIALVVTAAFSILPVLEIGKWFLRRSERRVPPIARAA